jgi:integrase
MSKKKGERGRGHVYLQHGAWYLQYYEREMRDGVEVRLRRSVFLHKKERGYDSATCKAISDLRTQELAKLPASSTALASDMRVVDYWDTRFLPYCKEVMEHGPRKGKPRRKASTLKGYMQIWEQFLKEHFGNITLQQYQPRLGRRFLDSLTAKKGYYTLKHIKSLATKIFQRAVENEIINMNPWRNVFMPEDVEKPTTAHYTREQSEDLVSALVDHVDAQLVLSLACFLALGPAEISGLRWEDIDADWIHIRRNIVNGEEDTTKTQERAAPVPILDEVRVPLELWRAKCGNPSNGWLFGDKPIVLPNLIARVIRPHVEGEHYGKECSRCRVIPKASRVRWQGMYTARRGAITHAIEASNGNIPLGQRLARHKSAKTTEDFYFKGITDRSFSESMKLLKK